MARKGRSTTATLAESAKPTNGAQRAELHKAIWRIANDLRGSVDGWDFKSYVLTGLFFRFISENLTAYLNEAERKAGSPDFDYAALDDAQAEFGRKETVAEKGFYILPSELFANLRKRAPQDENLNETLVKVFQHIEGSAVGTDSETDLKGLFSDFDVNSGKLGSTVAKRNAKLVKLLDAIGGLDLGDFANHEIDAFGDAYEFLMTMYASSAGKSGGEFFTPQEVSELLTRITVVGKTQVNKVYDPACGSGSLLLNFAKVLGKENVRRGFFGQEINLTTYNLARINMFLHDINYEHFDIAHGDTLTEPAHWDDEPFEAIVSNPPYSIHWEGEANPLLINDPRYAPAGVLAPRTKADLAFTMHMLAWLAVTGTAAIVVFPGVLYRSGSEAKIRKYLVDNNYIDAVIKLPPDLFFGTTIQTCILVLKKSKKDNSILFVDASVKFVRSSNNNRLSDADRDEILAAYAVRENADYFAHVVSNSEVAGNGYDLAVSRYVEQEDNSEVADIAAVVVDTARIVGVQQSLRDKIAAMVTPDGQTVPQIDAMIGALCPEGIPWRPVAEVVSNLDSQRRPVTRSDRTMGMYPYYGANGIQDYVDDFLFDGTFLLIGEDGSVVQKDGTPVLNWATGKIWVNNHAHVLTARDSSQLDLRFLFYFMQTVDITPFVTGGAQPKLNQGNLNRVQVPIPPVELQHEIVRLLDTYTALQAELERELDARKVQFGYYRDRLVRFGGKPTS